MLLLPQSCMTKLLKGELVTFFSFIVNARLEKKKITAPNSHRKM